LRSSDQVGGRCAKFPYGPEHLPADVGKAFRRDRELSCVSASEYPAQGREGGRCSDQVDFELGLKRFESGLSVAPACGSFQAAELLADFFKSRVGTLEHSP